METQLTKRLTLQKTLKEMLGTDNVYFQPPASIRLVYPCIVYELGGFHVRHANNSVYKKENRYSVTYITKNPDDPTIDKFVELDYCSLNKHYVVDNLHHYTYTIYI